jgi:capsular polysaccharide transport system ATP-binding protein
MSHEIRLENIHKSYEIHHGRDRRMVLEDINLRILPGERWGIMGPNGAGKSTLINLISGSILPDSGTLYRGMSVSWPLAFSGAFHGALTGRDNARLIARVYGKPIDETVEFVESFSELGSYFDEPVKSYSTGMGSRLGFALSMAMDFDCFLVDEVISVGDIRFNKKCETFLKEKVSKSMLLVTHHADIVRHNCTHAAFLNNGSLRIFDDIEEAVRAYEGLAR